MPATGRLTRRQACLALAGAACAAALPAWADPAAGTGTSTSAGAGAASGRWPAAASDAGHWQAWPAARATPPLDLPDAEGMPWRLAQQAGHPVLINFWAGWCEPCLAELPALAALAQREQARGLRVVAVNFKEGTETVRRVAAAHGTAMVWLRDSYGEAARAWGVRSFPASVLVGRNGRAQWSVRGAVDWADASVLQRLAANG